MNELLPLYIEGPRRNKFSLSSCYNSKSPVFLLVNLLSQVLWSVGVHLSPLATYMSQCLKSLSAPVKGTECRIILGLREPWPFFETSKCPEVKEKRCQLQARKGILCLGRGRKQLLLVPALLLQALVKLLGTRNRSWHQVLEMSLLENILPPPLELKLSIYSP